MKDGINGNHILENVPQGEVKDSFVRPAVLICEKIHEKSPVYNLPDKKDFFIGKNSENDLCLEGDDVSGVHAKIRPEKDNYMLYDLASKSGLIVNFGKRLKCKLEHKDRIKIGSHALIFEFVKEEEIFDGADRRKIGRVVLPMTLKLLVNVDNKLEEVNGIVKNINLSGAKIEMSREVLHKGDTIEAGISSSELPLVEVVAQVIWERVKQTDSKIVYDVGLQFIEIDEKSRSRLNNYIDKL